MKVLLTTAAASLIVVAGWAGGSAATQEPMCPPEVASAKAMLNARGGQLSRSRDEGTQVVTVTYNRGAETRGNQDAQTSDYQDAQTQDAQTPPISGSTPSASQRVQVLVKEAEDACKSGDVALASEKALAALQVMAE